MIVVRAPLRVSFVGGGTDFANFYTRTPGRVISTAIDKWVYLVINKTPMIDRISARYSITETVDKLDELQHTRIKAALLDLGIEKGIEIGSFASLPTKTGLGSSSSFSVALMKGLHASFGRSLTSYQAAEEACRLEITLLGEPIGKQDQYAAAFGGLNRIQFNPDHSVEVKPILMNYHVQSKLEGHLLMFFTGITRFASKILIEQKNSISQKFDTLREMADSTFDFEKVLLKGDIKGVARILHSGWLLKRSIASAVSNSAIDNLYNIGIGAGALGGKVLGAGGGGCILFVVPPKKRSRVSKELLKESARSGLSQARVIPFRFVNFGTEVVFDDQIA